MKTITLAAGCLVAATQAIHTQDRNYPSEHNHIMSLAQEDDGPWTMPASMAQINFNAYDELRAGSGSYLNLAQQRASSRNSGRSGGRAASSGRTSGNTQTGRSSGVGRNNRGGATNNGRNGRAKVVEPEPEVVEPQPEVVEPQPEVVEPELTVSEPEVTVSEPEVTVSEEESSPAYNSPAGVIQEGLRYYGYKEFYDWYKEWKKLPSVAEILPEPEFWNQDVFMYEIPQKAEDTFHTLYDMMDESNQSPIYDELMNQFYGEENKEEEQLREEYMAKRCFWENKAKELQSQYEKDKSITTMLVEQPVENGKKQEFKILPHSQIVKFTRDANGITLQAETGPEWDILSYIVGLDMCEHSVPVPNEMTTYKDMFMYFTKECQDDANPLQAQRCEQFCLLQKQEAGCKPLAFLDTIDNGKNSASSSMNNGMIMDSIDTSMGMMPTSMEPTSMMR